MEVDGDSSGDNTNGKILSTEEILQIENAKDKKSAKALAEEYGISLGRIYRIWRKAKKQKQKSFVEEVFESPPFSTNNAEKVEEELFQVFM